MSLEQVLQNAIDGKNPETGEAIPVDPVEPEVKAAPKPKPETPKEKPKVDDEEGDEEAALSFKEAVDEAKEEIETEPKRVERIIEDGIEREIPIEELIKGYQKASVSGKRFSDASKSLKEAQSIRQEVQDFVELMETNPIVALYEVLGEEKTNQTLEQYRKEMKAFEQMSPAEQENYILKRRMNTDQTKRNFQADKQQEILSDEEAQHIKESLTMKIEKVTSEYGLDTSEQKMRLLNKMKSYANHNGSANLDQTEIEILADQVRKETSKELTGYVKNLKGQALIDALGEDTANEVRSFYLERYKTQKAQKVDSGNTTDTVRERKEIKSLNDYKDFFNDPSAF